MYDGIFEDVQHVKQVLAIHGHVFVDETLVFELLEDLRVKEHVVKVLLGSRLKQSSKSNSSDSSLSPNRNVESDGRTSLLGGGGDSSYFSSTLDESGLEGLDEKSLNTKHGSNDKEAVDLTMEDQLSAGSASSSSTSPSHQEDKRATVIDLTNEILGAKRQRSASDNYEDTIEIKSEDTDANNSATDSEFEMDDYYLRRDMESEESEGFVESDDKVSPSTNPVLDICLNFEIPSNNDASNPETGENRMEEMLEENNNDPNNNLEDIEVLEQNNSASTTIQNLNSEKEVTEERPISPKPGCSKDSYYADSDFCLSDNSKENKNQKFVAVKRPNVANVFEDEDYPVGNCIQLSGISIDRDAFLIQKLLPNFTKAKILSTLMANQEAINRVEIALWELLPEEKPAPVLHSKRKHSQENICPCPIKRFSKDSAPNIKLEPHFESESAKMDVETPHIGVPDVKRELIKPATFSVSDIKKPILTPAKFELSNTKPVSPPAMNIPKDKSSILLKPSILEHIVPQSTHNNTTGAAEIPKSIPHTSTNITDIPNVNETNTIPKNQMQIPDIEKRPEHVTQFIANNPVSSKASTNCDFTVNIRNTMKTDEAATSNFDKTSALYRNPTKTGVEKKPKGSVGFTPDNPGTSTSTAQISYKASNSQIPCSKILTKEGSDQSKSNSQTTGTITTKLVHKQKETEMLGNKKKSAVNSDNVAATISESMWLQILKSSASLLNNGEQEFRKNHKPQLNQNDPKHNKASGSKLDTRVPSPSNQINNLNVKPCKPKIVGAPVLGNADLPKQQENNTAENPEKNNTNNILNPHFIHRVGNIQLAIPNSTGNREPNNIDIPKVKKKHHHQNRIENQIVHGPIINNAVRAAGPIEVDLTKINKQDISPPKELFNPLINIFPDVDPTYITELCITAKAQNQSMESLVEILLINGVQHPRIIHPEPEPNDMSPDTQYENLQGIFPDAHPEYLRGIAEKYYKDPDAIKEFVQRQLENPEYPTLADYLKKIKITEQINQYTNEFSPEKFLKIFPEPFAHFENPKRVYRYNVLAFEFLKSHFRANRVATIQRLYRGRTDSYHTSLTAKALEAIGPDMKSKRPEKMVPTEDIPLLQEFAFIRHKAEIRQYITAQQLQEKEIFDRLKKNKELLECQCCYDEECMPSKCLTCTEGHIFCTQCIKMGSATKIGEGQTQFPCFIECKGEFSLLVLQKVLEPTMFSILLRKRQEEEVKAAGLEGLVSCPFCHFASIPPPEDKVFKCLNPECMKESCRLCEELNHVPLRCDEVIKGQEARLYLEEKMTEALVRKCYSCSRPFFKDDGCNKMTCPCGATSCYICGQPVKNYSHFNGQGGGRADRCPLYSDTRVLNAQTVRVVAEATEKQIMKKNPNLKIDAKALMPVLPQATRGPHQDIGNAHVLPVHARRV